MNRSDCLLGVLAKHWQAGESKTRLAASVGAERASQLARAFLATSLKRMASLPVDRQLCFYPPDRRAEFSELAGESWTITVQQPGDLGTRMQSYFESALRQSAKRVVLIGSDTPHLPLDLVRWAFNLLSNHRAVIGPSRDGGYYLIGLSVAVPAIFEGMTWSHPSVFRATVDRFKSLGVPFAALPQWYDIDDVRDLEQLQHDLLVTSDLDLKSLADEIGHVMGT